MMELPSCLDCKYSDLDHPCRTAHGGFDFPKVGGGIVRYGRTFARDGENLDPTARDANAWASDCAYEVEQDYPHLVLPLIVAAMDACETPQDAAYVAAGILENAVANHGPLLIDKIEALAALSPKFRYFLSAIWGERSTDPVVWARVCAAVGSVGVMDQDERCPTAGGDVVALSDDQATALLKERVAAAAASVKI
jgi:hypothetical protein